MSVSEVGARRSLVGKLDVVFGLLLGVVLVFATVLVARAWSSAEHVGRGGSLGALAAGAALAAGCTLVALNRPAVALWGGACLVVLIVIGRLTWTIADLDVDPWSFDLQATVGTASAQLLTWACAAVLLAGGVVGRAHRFHA